MSIRQSCSSLKPNRTTSLNELNTYQGHQNKYVQKASFCWYCFSHPTPSELNLWGDSLEPGGTALQEKTFLKDCDIITARLAKRGHSDSGIKKGLDHVKEKQKEASSGNFLEGGWYN